MLTNQKADKHDAFSEKISPREQDYIHQDDVLKEVSEADEEEKAPNSKRPESEAGVRHQKDLLKEESKSPDAAKDLEKGRTPEKPDDKKEESTPGDAKARKKATEDIDIRVDNDW